MKDPQEKVSGVGCLGAGHKCSWLDHLSFKKGGIVKILESERAEDGSESDPVCTYDASWFEPALKGREGLSALNPLVLFLINPMRDCFKWALVEGQSVFERGEALTAEELVAISKRYAVSDVFVDQGFRTAEVRDMSEKNGWHCVKGRAGSHRDGIAEWIDQACSFPAILEGFEPPTDRKGIFKGGAEDGTD